MRRRLILIACGVLILVLGVGILVARGGDDRPVTRHLPGLEVQQVSAGPVEVELSPDRLDDQGAAFTVAFDTHVADLGMDLPDAATLSVNGVDWPAEEWSGDGPEGHHRAGELTFTPRGPATGTVRLTIDGLPEPVVVTWELPG